MNGKFAIIISILGVLGFLNSVYISQCANAFEEEIFISGIAYSLYAVPPVKSVVKDEKEFSEPVLKYAPPPVHKQHIKKEDMPVMVKYAPPEFFKEKNKIKENVAYPEYAVPNLDNQNTKSIKENDIRLDILFFEEK